MKWTVDHILQEFYSLFLTRFRTYKIASPPLTKMPSKDDIKGLVSLKFLRPWWELYSHRMHIRTTNDVMFSWHFLIKKSNVKKLNQLQTTF